MDSNTSAYLLTETPGYWEQLAGVVGDGRITGVRLHDAHVAALCLHHGVDELWTADRDFGRFPSVDVRNPLVG